MRKGLLAQMMLVSAAVLLGGVLPSMTWAGALRCTINTGGAAPFSPYTRENPIAVDEDTPDYTVVLALDYAQFLPNMKLSCTTDGQEVSAPAGFDGNISLSLSAINDTALDWTGLERLKPIITVLSLNFILKRYRIMMKRWQIAIHPLNWQQGNSLVLSIRLLTVKRIQRCLSFALNIMRIKVYTSLMKRIIMPLSPCAPS